MFSLNITSITSIDSNQIINNNKVVGKNIKNLSTITILKVLTKTKK